MDSLSLQEGQQLIIDRIDAMSIKLSSLSDSQEQSNFNIKQAVDTIGALQQRVVTLESTVDTLESKVGRLEASNQKLQAQLTTVLDRSIKLESQSRRDNLVIDGISESDPEDCFEKVRHVFSQTMGIQDADKIMITRCHRLGRKQPHSSRPRPMILKFHWFGDRQRVWAAKNKLKGKDLWISEDFPQEIRERRRILTPIFKKARSLGKQAFFNVDKLIIDGKSYCVDNLSTLPAELNPAMISTPQYGENITAFFGGASPLSNFHHAPFTVENHTFMHVEQFYQFKKAKFAGKDEVADDILRTPSPLQCFIKGQSINRAIDLGHWHQNEGLKVMRKACFEKFSQNPRMKEFLLNTKDRTLVEASEKDVFWGIGLKLSDPSVADNSKWKGQNHLGLILCEVRDRLRQ